MTYRGHVTPSPGQAFANGFANGAAIGGAIRARMDRAKVFRGCMLSLGWDEVEAPRQYELPAGAR